MLKIAIGCIFYQCYEELKRLIDSIPKGFIDYIIAIDGIYKYNKEQNPTLPLTSTDGSRDLIMYNNNKFEYNLVDLSNTTEFEKRNLYLEICQELNVDVLLIVDSDEFFIFPEGVKPEDAFNTFKRNLELTINKHKKDHNVFGIRTLNIHEKEDDKIGSYKPRIWYKPAEMRYVFGSHYHYANVVREKETLDSFKANRICYCQHCESVVKGIILAHDHGLRTEKQIQLHDQYVEYLKRFEGLVQSHRYSLDDAHNIAKSGKSYEDILREQMK